jgi:predicted type IV restriction endonuclease
MSLPKGAIKKQLNKQDITKTPFIMFQAHKDDYYDMSIQSANNINKESILSRVFFSPENTIIIQKRIIMEILKETKGKYQIEPQDKNDIRAVQQFVFMNNNKDIPNNTDAIRQRVGELNDIAVSEIVPDIITNLNSYFHYLRDSQGSMQIMDRPENVSNAGRKLLPSSTTKLFDY